jgi:hypothetical protein
MQMSAAWIEMYASQIAGVFIDAISNAIGQQLGGTAAKHVIKKVTDALLDGTFDFYMLRGRKHPQGWKLRGFRLLHLDGDPKNVARGPYEREDPIQRTYPEMGHLPDPL